MRSGAIAGRWGDLRWLVGAVGIRFATIALTAGVSVVSIAALGAAGFGPVITSLVTTGFLAPIGSAGVGRLALRDLDAGSSGLVVGRYLRTRPALLAGPVVALAAHVVLVSLVLGWSDLAPSRLAAIALAGGLHTAAASAVMVASDLLRVAGHDLVADATAGRLGGSITSLVALVLITLPLIGGRAIDPSWCLLALAFGAAVSTGMATVVLARNRTGPLDSDPTRRVPIAPGVSHGLAAQLADWGRYCGALAVGPLVAATPVWLAGRSLEPVQIGAFGLATQSVAAVGAVGMAITGRTMASLSGLFSGPERRSGVQRAHDRVAPILLAAVAGTYALTLLAVAVAAPWLVPEAPTLYLTGVAVLGGAQVWQAAMGMTGAQLQLSGHPGPVIAVGLSRAVITALLIIGLPASPGYLLLAVAVPALAGPYLLNRVTLSATGIEASAIRRVTAMRPVGRSAS